jgi:hypothetical protein
LAGKKETLKMTLYSTPTADVTNPDEVGMYDEADFITMG